MRKIVSTLTWITLPGRKTGGFRLVTPDLGDKVVSHDFGMQIAAENGTLATCLNGERMVLGSTALAYVTRFANTRNRTHDSAEALIASDVALNAERSFERACAKAVRELIS